MGESMQTRLDHWILPAVASGLTAGNSNAINVACSTTAVVIDLSTMDGLPEGWPYIDGPNNPSPLGHYFRICADGGDIYALFGPSYASVSGITTVNTTTVTAGTGVVTMAPKIPMKVPDNAWQDFLLPIGPRGGSSSDMSGKQSPCRFLALITTTGSPTARCHQSSL